MASHVATGRTIVADTKQIAATGRNALEGVADGAGKVAGISMGSLGLIVVGGFFLYLAFIDETPTSFLERVLRYGAAASETRTLSGKSRLLRPIVPSTNPTTPDDSGKPLVAVAVPTSATVATTSTATSKTQSHLFLGGGLF